MELSEMDERFFFEHMYEGLIIQIRKAVHTVSAILKRKKIHMIRQRANALGLN